MRWIVCGALSVATMALGTMSQAPAATGVLPPYAMSMPSLEAPPDRVIERRYTPAFAACQRLARSSLGNSLCFEGEFVRQDARLNAAWRRAVGRISPAARRPLLIAQRRWIGARDPFCRSYSDGFGRGTFAPVAYTSCRVEQTIRRSLWLGDLRL